MSANAAIQRHLVGLDSTLKDVVARINALSGDIVLVVNDDGILKGLVTDGDVRRAILRGKTTSSVVTEFMTEQFTSGRAAADHADNVKLLSTKIRHLPLLDDAGRPVAVLSWASLMRLPLVRPDLGGNEMNYVMDCVSSGWVSSIGPYVDKFERAFSAYLGGGHARATSSGTTALHLALVAYGIGPGDEVIVPDLTFGATANVVVHCGATPVFVDVDPRTVTLDPKAMAAAITPRTKAVIPVHLYGHPCDMDPIMDLARAHNIKVIEDCAESLGAEYKGRKVGLIGDVGCFSFFANKVITTGEGGMVTTNDPAIHEKMSILRDHGMSKERRYWHLYPGFNYRMTNLQAALGLAQIEQIEKFLAIRNGIAKRYTQRLLRVPGLQLPVQAPWAKNIYWLYSIGVRPEFGMDRDTLRSHLSVRAIETRDVFYPLHGQPAYTSGRALPCPVSADFAARGLSLPTGNDLTIEEVERVCAALEDIAHTQRMVGMAKA